MSEQASVDLSQHMERARFIAKAGDVVSSGMIIQLVELLLEASKQLKAQANELEKLRAKAESPAEASPPA